MSEPTGAGEPEGAGPRKSVPRRWVRSRTTRWVAAGAAVVVIGGGAAAVAVHHEGEDRGDGKRSVASDGARHGGHDGRSGRGSHDGLEGREGREGRDRATDTGTAPAPLPALDAADAVVKAAGAVQGGKVESLRPVTEQGGGRAWRVVVVGPDGVRHAVVVDGTTFAITSNTVLGG
ncbi:hypothetical protein ACGFX4_16340 [Kitasatospora sp. NPDC048365]|uniref:hypothetical protein n=1 Tax=Kitasatospora sp. NPDC048365 TaxID=3364050 RepID=UPI00371B8E36